MRSTNFGWHPCNSWAEHWTSAEVATICWTNIFNQHDSPELHNPYCNMNPCCKVNILQVEKSVLFHGQECCLIGFMQHTNLHLEVKDKKVIQWLLKATKSTFFLPLKIYMDHLLQKYCHGVSIYRETTYQWEIMINILEISLFSYTQTTEATFLYTFIHHTSLFFAIQVYLILFFYIHYKYLYWTSSFPNKLCTLKCLLNSTRGQLTHL